MPPGEVLLEDHLFVVCRVVPVLWSVLDPLQYGSHAGEETLGLEDVLLGQLETIDVSRLKSDQGSQLLVEDWSDQSFAIKNQLTQKKCV